MHGGANRIIYSISRANNNTQGYAGERRFQQHTLKSQRQAGVGRTEIAHGARTRRGSAVLVCVSVW